jgi:serine/threonine-protein kinase
MEPEHWDALSGWLNRWLEADPSERERLRADLAVERPDLLSEAEALTAATGEIRGFLETPALVVAAREIAQEEPLLPSAAMVGPYRIVSLLARGGMGDVYRATDVRLERDVALKVLPETRTGDPRRVERFLHEARVTASLDHPNIVRVYDVGRFEERAYLVAELLEGETLRARISRNPIPAGEALRIGIEIARGLGAAHAAGLVHRDLKPDNVFLTRAGTTKILDFGIAKLAQDETVPGGYSTLTGVVLGTTGYLSPEQIRGARIDARADLFALGVVLFEMLTGTPAFAREHVVETLHAILHDSPPGTLAENGDVPPALFNIVMRLLDKDPDCRFQSAAEVIAALEAVDVTDRRRVGPAARIGRSRTGFRRVVLAVAAVVAVASGVMFFIERQSSVAEKRLSLTLAVMPFRSLPADKDSDLLELGLADVLISRLGQLGNVRVLPLSATERLRSLEPVAVARKLGADRILTVTLQHEKDRVRAVPRLMSTSGEPIWSTTVDTDASSVFSIQDIIVTKVIEELEPKLSSGGKSRLASAGTRNNAAFEAYVRGRAYVLKPTGADLSRAKECFEEALKLDPGYADAWAGLGSAYKRMPIAAGVNPKDAFPKAKEAATRALQLDANHAEAQSVLGTVAFWYDWDYPRAERLLHRAMELQPSSADSALFLAHLYANLGRFDEALEEIRRARALDPAWPLARAHEGHFLFMSRRYQQALEHLNDSVKIDPQFWPGHTFRMLTLLALDRYEDALGESETSKLVRRANPGGPSGYDGFALARMGRRADAERVLEGLRTRTPRGIPYAEAVVLHGLGREQESLRRLQNAVEDRTLGVTFLGVYPVWDNLRNSPEFRRVVSRVNLLEVSDRILRDFVRSRGAGPRRSPA